MSCFVSLISMPFTEPNVVYVFRRRKHGNDIWRNAHGGFPTFYGGGCCFLTVKLRVVLESEPTCQSSSLVVSRRTSVLTPDQTISRRHISTLSDATFLPTDVFFRPFIDSTFWVKGATLSAWQNNFVYSLFITFT